MNKQLTATLMALVLLTPLLLTGCWRKKSIALGAGKHSVEISKTGWGKNPRYGIDAK